MSLDRDAYYHRVQVTQAIATAIENEVALYSGENWAIEFTEDFWFRIVDKTDPQMPQSFQWFINLDDVGKKFMAIFPTIQIKALTA